MEINTPVLVNTVQFDMDDAEALGNCPRQGRFPRERETTKDEETGSWDADIRDVLVVVTQRKWHSAH
jgi:hypothetical protein